MEFDSSNGEHVRAGYFLMHFRREHPADEQREISWQPFDKAFEMIGFENARGIIRASKRQTRI
jgi:hypothetical protein